MSQETLNPTADMQFNQGIGLVQVKQYVELPGK